MPLTALWALWRKKWALATQSVAEYQHFQTVSESWLLKGGLKVARWELETPRCKCPSKWIVMVPVSASEEDDLSPSTVSKTFLWPQEVETLQTKETALLHPWILFLLFYSSFYFHVINIFFCFSFWDCLTSLSMMISTFVYFPSKDMVSPCVWWKNASLCKGAIFSLSIHLSTWADSVSEQFGLCQNEHRYGTLHLKCIGTLN